MLPNILAMAPVAFLFVVFCLTLTRLSRGTGPLATALGGLAFGLASGIALGLQVKVLLEGGPVGQGILFALVGFQFTPFLFFLAVTKWRGVSERDRCGLAMGTWLLNLTMFLFLFPRDYDQNLWFLDLMNKTLRNNFGTDFAGPAAGVFLATFGAVNHFLAQRFVELASLGTLVPAYAAYVLFCAYFDRGRVQRFQAIQAPRWVPPAFLILTGIWLGWNAVGGASLLKNFLDILLRVFIGGYAFLGCLTLFGWSRRGREGIFASGAIVVAAFFLGAVIPALAILGFFQNLLGWRSKKEDSTRPIPSRLPAAMQSLMSVKSLVVMAAGSFLFLILVNAPDSISKERGRVLRHADPSAPSDMRLIESPAGDFLMDIYEFPNRKGAVPQTGLTLAEARDQCRERGKRLCTSREWESACRGPSGRNYIFAEDALADRVVLHRRCNILPIWAPAKGKRESGRLDCVNGLGLIDMIGNVWEWVEGPENDPFRKLKGGSYQFNDDQTTHCAFEMLLLDAQIERLDLSPVGFRCCKDWKIPSNSGFGPAGRARDHRLRPQVGAP